MFEGLNYTVIFDFYIDVIGLSAKFGSKHMSDVIALVVSSSILVGFKFGSLTGKPTLIKCVVLALAAGMVGAAQYMKMTQAAKKDANNFNPTNQNRNLLYNFSVLSFHARLLLVYCL